MHVDFKIITWERVEIPEGKEEEILEALKSGKIECSNDIFNSIEEGCSSLTYEIIPEAEQQLSVEDNDGYSTIEAYESKGDDVPIWHNGTEDFVSQ